jgi:hypothetical protein
MEKTEVDGIALCVILAVIVALFSMRQILLVVLAHLINFGLNIIMKNIVIMMTISDPEKLDVKNAKNWRRQN